LRDFSLKTNATSNTFSTRLTLPLRFPEKVVTEMKRKAKANAVFSAEKRLKKCRKKKRKLKN
jgi:hypothetical protein